MKPNTCIADRAEYVLVRQSLTEMTVHFQVSQVIAGSPASAVPPAVAAQLGMTSFSAGCLRSFFQFCFFFRISGAVLSVSVPASRLGLIRFNLFFYARHHQSVQCGRNVTQLLGFPQKKKKYNEELRRRLIFSNNDFVIRRLHCLNLRQPLSEPSRDYVGTSARVSRVCANVRIKENKLAQN